VATFGAQLKQEREKQGVTLEEISLSTKIGTRMLRALEEEHFDQLPGGIFNKGFIRAYARCLGMDEDQAVADYLSATGTSPLSKKSEIDDPPPILEPPSRDENAGGLPWGTFAVVLLIVALGFAAWGFYSRQAERTAQDPTPPSANSSRPSPTAPAETSRSEQKPVVSADSASATSQADQRPAETKSVAESAPSAAASAPLSAPAVAQQPTVSGKPTFQVVINAREDSWLSVSVDGEIVTRAMLAAPAQKSIRAQNEITIRAGNVGALDFEFNGKKLPTQGEFGEAKTLTFDASGLQATSPKPETPKPDASTQPPQ
jgi:cytoskeleton protein RodZ